MVGISFEVDDKDQNHVITFKSQSLPIILGVLQKQLEQYCSKKTHCTSLEMAHFLSPVLSVHSSFHITPHEQGEGPHKH